jgi:hypothetical protein
MSKFLLNLLVQISKAFIYSKIQILFGNNSPQLSAHSTQLRLILFFSFQPAAPPLPTGPQPLGRPSRPRALVAPCRIATSPQEDASSRAAFALSSFPADRWTPPVIPHLRPTRARSCRHHLPPLPALPSPTSDATWAFTTPPSFPPP